MRILVTGASGFVGRHLVKSTGALDLERAGGRVDIRDRESLREALGDREFDAVVHLAAQSFVPESFADPEATFSVNFNGTYNLLYVLREVGFKGKLLYVSSGDTYGLVSPDSLPIQEDHPLRPRSPYAVSKVAAEALCYQWSQTGSFELVMARPFNHIGPGQSERFAVSEFARQIARIKLGRQEPVLMTGDIDVTRDFTDVRDIVAAYVSLLEAGSNSEVYNVCSGKEYSLRSLIGQMLEISGIDVQIETDPNRMRKNEQTRVYGSYAKLHGQTGWQPSIPIGHTLKEVLEYWEVALDE